MRVVGGQWRGRALEAPEGRDVTRPTTDRTREAIASMVLSARGLDLGSTSVLDPFAGSGACGIELLSRGAAHATFCDIDRAAAARVRRNLQSLGAAPDTFDVLRADVLRDPSRRLPGAPFGVVFLDPPYKMPASDVSGLVLALMGAGQLEDGATVIYERASDAPTLEGAGLTLVRTKRHGSTSVDLMTMEAQ